MAVNGKGGEKCGKQGYEATRQGDGAEASYDMMRIALPRRSGPHGRDEGRVLVRHLLGADHCMARRFFACQPHDGKWVVRQPAAVSCSAKLLYE